MRSGLSPYTARSRSQVPRLAAGTAGEDPRPPAAAPGPAESKSKQRRREALTQLDHLLEQLERANLAGHESAPPEVVSELLEGGRPDATPPTIPELIEIVFDRQERLMRANKEAQRTVARHRDGDRGNGPEAPRSRVQDQLGPIWW